MYICIHTHTPQVSIGKGIKPTRFPKSIGGETKQTPNRRNIKLFQTCSSNPK